jgi:hypothetical protein
MKKNFKNAPGNGRKNKSNLNQINQENGSFKSFYSDLNDLETSICANFTLRFLEERKFTMSNLQMAHLSGASELEIENAVNHLINLKYLKIVPSAKNFSYLRFLEPDKALTDTWMRIFLQNPDNPELSI